MWLCYEIQRRVFRFPRTDTRGTDLWVVSRLIRVNATENKGGGEGLVVDLCKKCIILGYHCIRGFGACIIHVNASENKGM